MIIVTVVYARCFFRKASKLLIMPLENLSVYNMEKRHQENVNNFAPASFTVKPKDTTQGYFASLERNFGDKTPIKIEMINLFLMQIPETVKKLETSLENNDIDAFHFEIHRIKSTINIIGLPNLLEMAIKMERLAYDKVDLEDLPNLFIQFRNQVEADKILLNKEQGRLKQMLN